MDGRKATATLVLFVASFGLIYVATLPPFGWGDEVPHFLRGLRVSRGEWVGTVENGQRGVHVSRGVARLLRSAAFSTLAWKNCTLDPQKLQTLATIADEGQRQFTTEFGASYAPLSSFHTGAAIRVARALDAPPVAWLYSARVANLALWTLLMLGALRLAPHMHTTLFALMVAPTALYLGATCSIDGILNGLAFLWTAYVLRLAASPEEAPTWKAWAIVVGLIVPLSLVKFIYAPLALLLLLVPAGRDTRWTPWIQITAVAAGLGGVAIALWLGATSMPTQLTFLRTEVDAQYASSRLWTEPLTSLLAIPRTIGASFYPWLINLAWPLWTKCMIGSPITVPLVWGAIAGSMLIDAERFQPTKAQRLVCLAVSGAIVSAVILAAFASWTPLGETHAFGVHSRYFLPVLPALAIALMPPRVRFSPRVRTALTISIFVALAMSVALVEIAFVRQYQWGGS